VKICKITDPQEEEGKAPAPSSCNPTVSTNDTEEKDNNTRNEPQAMKHLESDNTAYNNEVRLRMDSKFISHFTSTSKWERCTPFCALVL